MDVWIKSLFDALITEEISHEGFQIVSLCGDWYDAIVSRWIFKVDFTTLMLCCCSQFLV